MAICVSNTSMPRPKGKTVTTTNLIHVGFSTDKMIYGSPTYNLEVWVRLLLLFCFVFQVQGLSH